MTEAAIQPRRGGAWLVWALGASCFAYAFLLRVAPSVMVEELMRDFAVGAAILGNLSALYLYAYAGLQIPVGVMLDHWGPRRMLTVSIAIAAVGTLIFAAADAIALAYLGRLMIGLGCAVGFVGTLKLVSQWFPPGRFAFLTGMTMLVAMTGGAAGQAPLAGVVGALGWRTTLFGTAAAGAVLATVIWLVVRDQPPGAAPAVRGGLRFRGLARDLGAVLGQRRNWMIALFGAFMSAPMLAYGGLWGVPHLMRVYALDRPVAAAATSMVLLGWAAGAPLAGWISDRLGRRRPVMLVGAVATLALWPTHLYLPGVPWAARWVLLALIGAASATMIVSMALARDSAPAHLTGGITGFVNAFAVGSGAVLQPIVGVLLDFGWDGRMAAGVRLYSLDVWQLAMLTMPACAVLSVLTALGVREARKRG